MYAKSKTAQRRPCGKNCLCYRVNDNCRHDGNLYCSFDFSSTGFARNLWLYESVGPDFFLFINHIFMPPCLFLSPFVTLFACLFFLIAWAILYAPDLMTEPEGAKILKRRRKVYLSFTIIFALLAIGTILLFALWPIR